MSLNWIISFHLSTLQADQGVMTTSMVWMYWLGIMNNYVWSDIMNAHGTAMAKWNLYNGPRDKDIHDTSNFQLWRTAEWIHWFPGTNHFNLASRRTALDYLLLMVLKSVLAIRDYAFLDWESNDTVRWL
jgi:hypothetical protein